MRNKLKGLTSILGTKLPQKGNVRYNYILGITNGSLFMFGIAFINPLTVLPVFIKCFTTSDFIVGIAGSLWRMGWLLPQLLVAGYVEKIPYKRNIYLRINSIRLLLTWLTIPLVATFAITQPTFLLVCFLLLFAFATFLGGIAGLPFNDMVAKTIPVEYLGSFFATRMFFGAGIMSIIAGFIVKYILSEEVMFPFPNNFVVIFTFAALFMTLGIASYSFVREPPSKISSTQRTFFGLIKEIPLILKRDVNYRRLIIVQLLSSGISFSLPFYIIIAQENFGSTVSTAGTFITAQTLGVLFFNLLWKFTSNHYGDRQVIFIALILQAIIPIYALIISKGFGFWLLQSQPWVVTAAFSPIFILIGGTMSGLWVGYSSYILSISPEDRRPTYVGTSNTILGIAAIFPALGGYIADRAGLHSVIVLSVLTVCVAIPYSRKLKAPTSRLNY